MRRAAFTAIELLIAIALGATICATAFVAVRVLGQSVATGNRLSIENQLMRAGVHAALGELDRWASYDDPAPGGDQPLRQDASPFFPLATAVPQAEDFNFEFLPVRDPGQPYEDWWRRDARTWFRSDPNTGITSIGDFGLGDYSLFGKLGYADGTALGGAEKRWRHRFVKECSSHLGYLAMIDYAPASLMYHYYDEDGITPPEFTEPASNGGTGTVISTTWPESKPHDFVCLTMGTFFTITVPSRVRNPLYAVPDINRSLFLAWVNFDTGAAANAGWSVDDAFTWCGGALPLLPMRPAHWPELSVTVRHYACNSRQFHTATVLTRSPVTAQVFKVSFDYTGTTLRGARRARGLDGTWSP